MATATGTADQAQAMMAGVAEILGSGARDGDPEHHPRDPGVRLAGATIVTVAIFFAVWLFVSGIYSIIGAFTMMPSTSMKVLSAIIGVLSVIVGFSPLRTPVPVGRGGDLRARHLLGVAGDRLVHHGLRGQAGPELAAFSAILGVVAGIIVLVYPISSALTLAPSAASGL